MTRPVGILGGTFDPVHFGHLRLAEEAREKLDLDVVRWIPSGDPGHRGDTVASPETRLEMVRLAIADNAAFQLDASEARSQVPTYTVPMLERLRAGLGGSVPLVVILGTDSFVSLPTWRDWTRLFDLAHFAVGERAGYPLSGRAMPPALAHEFARRRATAAALPARPAGAVVPFDMTPLEISATDLRSRLARGASGRYLIPETVLQYIAARGLYRGA